jgi:hypothetical protein
LIMATYKQKEQCTVRSGTDNPCLRPAMVKVRGIPFCEPCAREQEAYFAIGELTEEPRSLQDDEQLVGLLGRMGASRSLHHVADNHQIDAA